MSKSQKQLLLGVSITLMLLSCVAIFGLLFVSVPNMSHVRLFYVADVKLEEIIEASFDVDGPAELNLSNLNGDVRVVGTEDDEIVVSAVKSVWGQDQQDAEAKLKALQVRMDQQGDQLTANVYDPDQDITYLVVGVSRASIVSFEIRVPQHTAVEIVSHNGDVSLEGVTGPAGIYTEYGNIDLDQVMGSLTAESQNGDITVQRSGSDDAQISLTGTYGSLAVQQVMARELSLESHNGNLSVESVVVEGKLVLETQYGRSDLDNIRVQALSVANQNGDLVLGNGQAEGKLDLYAEYGAIQVDGVEATEYRLETQNGDIELNGARGPLWVHTEYGDINVNNANEAMLDLYARNGRVQFEGSLSPDFNHQAESEYGEVRLRLPRNTAVLLDAGTEYGDISCEFELDAQVGNEDDGAGEELIGSINNGSARLTANSHNGNILIEMGLGD